MQGNVLAGGDADNGELLSIEHYQAMESPTINMLGPYPNSQGITLDAHDRKGVVMDYDFYSGFMDLDESIFFQFATRYYGPSKVSPVSGAREWSGILTYPFIVFQPDPFCVRGSNGGAADNVSSTGFPAGNVDSLRVSLVTLSQGFRFNGTNLGNTRGTYFDNVRVGFTGGAPDLSQEIWNKYQDTFPSDGWSGGIENGPVPGSVNFDTTTALMKSGLTISPTASKSYTAGDTILANSPFFGDGTTTGVRMDLIFRILPGPGNYTVKGDPTSPLRSAAFWTAYQSNVGPFGTGAPAAVPAPNTDVAFTTPMQPRDGGGAWNPNVWCSARMDSADTWLYPISSRAIGGPASPVWMGALHEQDRNFNTLGLNNQMCFLINPAGSNVAANTICGAYPSPDPGYAATGAPLTTKEGTKILPDGLFTPGTHIEYFMRRSTIDQPQSYSLLFDTTTVFPQDATGNSDTDALRWSQVNVFPDMWKDGRFGGQGLACILLVNDDTRRGAIPAYRGAADSTGFGKNNGAGVGWKGPGTDPNNPAGFVAKNLGQSGLSLDLYEIRAAESAEGGHLGSRLAAATGAEAAKVSLAGPSAAMLNFYYNTIIYASGDLSGSTIFDAFDNQEQANDISLFTAYLNGANAGSPRAMWLSGDGIMDDGYNNSDDGTHLYPFLTNFFGSDLTNNNYKGYSSTAAPQVVDFLPTASWAHPGRTYGFNNVCSILADVLARIPTVADATEGAQYQNTGPAPYTANVYRPSTGSRFFKTSIDGFDLSHIEGNGPASSASDNGRIAWFDDVLSGHIALCARKGPVIAVGDGLGVDGARFANVNLGAFPNPAFAASHVTLQFSLAKAQNITVRIYNVAGREVSKFSQVAKAGLNNVVWNGTLSSGAKASPGVYFYRVDGIQFAGGSNANKVILLGAN